MVLTRWLQAFPGETASRMAKLGERMAIAIEPKLQSHHNLEVIAAILPAGAGAGKMAWLAQLERTTPPVQLLPNGRVWFVAAMGWTAARPEDQMERSGHCKGFAVVALLSSAPPPLRQAWAVPAEPPLHRSPARAAWTAGS